MRRKDPPIADGSLLHGGSVGPDQNGQGGSVVDENDTPVIRATVIVKDSPTLGTSTDVNGEFVLKDASRRRGNYRFPMWVIRPGQ